MTGVQTCALPISHALFKDKDSVYKSLIETLQQACINDAEFKLRVVDVYGEKTDVDVNNDAGLIEVPVQYFPKDAQNSSSLSDLSAINKTITEVEGLRPSRPLELGDKLPQVEMALNEKFNTRYAVRMTPNNPESSRSHLVVRVEITVKKVLRGLVTIMDMGGSEDVTAIQAAYFNIVPMTTATSVIRNILTDERNFLSQLTENPKVTKDNNFFRETRFYDTTFNEHSSHSRAVRSGQIRRGHILPTCRGRRVSGHDGAQYVWWAYLFRCGQYKKGNRTPKHYRTN